MNGNNQQDSNDLWQAVTSTLLRFHQGLSEVLGGRGQVLVRVGQCGLSSIWRQWVLSWVWRASDGSREVAKHGEVQGSRFPTLNMLQKLEVSVATWGLHASECQMKVGRGPRWRPDWEGGGDTRKANALLGGSYIPSQRWGMWKGKHEIRGGEILAMNPKCHWALLAGRNSPSHCTKETGSRGLETMCVRESHLEQVHHNCFLAHLKPHPQQGSLAPGPESREYSLIPGRNCFHGNRVHIRG